MVGHNTLSLHTINEKNVKFLSAINNEDAVEKVATSRRWRPQLCLNRPIFYLQQYRQMKRSHQVCTAATNMVDLAMN